MIQIKGSNRPRTTLLDHMSVVETVESSITSLTTLQAVLMADHSKTSSSRNQSNQTLFDIMRRDHSGDKTVWEILWEKLSLIRNTTAWISSNTIPTLNTDVPALNTTIPTLNTDVSATVEEKSARMSLMELLEEEEEEEEREEKDCCVCMIRSKGAAFIPCGHTFCRLCSRKLWLERRNCPLCNTSILDILNIF